jgi:hypothetical protein
VYYGRPAYIICIGRCTLYIIHAHIYTKRYVYAIAHMRAYTEWLYTGIESIIVPRRTSDTIFNYANFLRGVHIYIYIYTYTCMCARVRINFFVSHGADTIIYTGNVVDTTWGPRQDSAAPALGLLLRERALRTFLINWPLPRPLPRPSESTNVHARTQLCTTGRW